MKKNLVTTIIMFLFAALVFNMTGCSMDATDNTDETENTEMIETTVAPSKYLTEITWAMDSHYMFAVEMDEFDGDAVEAGTYRFYPDAVVLGTKKIPVVWDIYVSNNVYTNISELHDDSPEFVGCVGGLDKLEIEVNLEKGQYVYVKYYTVANNNPTGMLQITKIN